MSKLAASSLDFRTLEEFWDRYSIELMPLTLRYHGKGPPLRRVLNLEIDPTASHFHWGLRVAGVDWGRPPDFTLAACPIVQTAALMLLDATREPESYLLAFEFAGDVLRTYGPSFITSAKFVRDWYADELAMIDEEGVWKP